MPQEERYALIRAVVPSDVAKARRAKRLSLCSAALKGMNLFVDGYNVLIAAESLLRGLPVYECDDGFIRDTQGIFRGYKPSAFTVPAVSQILGLLSEAAPDRVLVIFDQQISMSGRLAGLVREMMRQRNIPGTADTAGDADHRLKSAGVVLGTVVATGDGNVIDAVVQAVDIPGEIAVKRGIVPLKL